MTIAMTDEIAPSATQRQSAPASACSELARPACQSTNAEPAIVMVSLTTFPSRPDFRFGCSSDGAVDAGTSALLVAASYPTLTPASSAAPVPRRTGPRTAAPAPASRTQSGPARGPARRDPAPGPGRSPAGPAHPRCRPGPSG